MLHNTRNILIYVIARLRRREEVTVVHLSRSSSVAWLTVVVLTLLCPAMIAMAQQASQPEAGTASCNFEDGKQIGIRYNRIPAGKADGPPLNRIWMPGGAAITLFSEPALTIGGVDIAPGGYTLYLLPGKKEWKLIVSKNTAVEGAYDEKQDIVRATMETGTLSQRQEELTVTLGHVGPQRCEFDVDFGRSKAWVEFKEK